MGSGFRFDSTVERDQESDDEKESDKGSDLHNAAIMRNQREEINPSGSGSV